MYLLDPTLSAEEVNGLKERFAELARSQGAESAKVSQWDRRRLAYPIKQKREGIYVIMNLRAESAAVQEIARQLKLTEPVLRHMVTRQEKAPPQEKAATEQREGEGK